MERAFVDTSAWVAYVNRRDRDHERVRQVFRDFSHRLVTSNFVFDETVTLCRYRLGHDVARRVGEALLDPRTVDLMRVSADDERSAWSLFLKREDRAYSFTDCCSFVVMRRVQIDVAVALDDDFRREGFRALPTEP